MASGPGYKRDPSHTVRVTAASARYVATKADVTLADSKHAYILSENGYPEVIYFPRDAVVLDRFSESETSTYCPFKGKAGYLALDGVDVAWFYAQPYDEVVEIKDCVAFYPQHVSVSAM